MVIQMTDQLDEAINRWVVGRVAIVNRVRNGKVQIRKVVNITKGFKIVKGQLVKMTPVEMRNRKRSAKIAVRKRKAEQMQINRNRTSSMRKRKTRLS